jgi:ribosomal protein S18 acetylase RimI-like enzyme
MTEKTTTRPYRPEDLVAVAEVDKEAFGDLCYPSYFFRQAYDLFGDLLLVAENEREEIVGYLLGALQADLAGGWILSVAVRKADRRQGIAEMLVKIILPVFLRKGVSTVWLTVAPENHGAIQLYLKLGFEQVSTEEDYFGPGEPRILMKRKIQ